MTYNSIFWYFVNTFVTNYNKFTITIDSNIKFTNFFLINIPNYIT